MLISGGKIYADRDKDLFYYEMMRINADNCAYLDPPTDYDNEYIWFLILEKTKLKHRPFEEFVEYCNWDNVKYEQNKGGWGFPRERNRRAGYYLRKKGKQEPINSKPGGFV